MEEMYTGWAKKEFDKLLSNSKETLAINLMEQTANVLLLQQTIDNVTKYIGSKIEEFNEFLMDLLAKEDSESKVKYGYYKDMRDIYQNLLNKIKEDSNAQM